MTANIQRLRAPSSRPDTMALLRGAQMTNQAMNQLSGSIGQFGRDRRSGQVNEFIAQDAIDLSPEQIRAQTALIGQGDITKQSQQSSDNLVKQLVAENVVGKEQDFLTNQQANRFNQQDLSQQRDFNFETDAADLNQKRMIKQNLLKNKQIQENQEQVYTNSQTLAKQKNDYKLNQIKYKDSLVKKNPAKLPKRSTWENKVLQGYTPDQTLKHDWLRKNNVQMIKDEATGNWKYKTGLGANISVDAAFEFMRNQQKLKNQKKPSPKETLNSPTSTVNMDNVPKGMESKPFNTGGTMLDRTTNKLLKAISYPGYN